MPKEIQRVPGQVRIDIYTGDLVIPSIAEIDIAQRRLNTTNNTSHKSIAAVSDEIRQNLIDKLKESSVSAIKNKTMDYLRRLAKEKKPRGAAISTEVLRIIKERINKKRKENNQPEISLSDVDFAKKLVVFRRGTEIKTDRDDVETRLNSTVVAWEAESMDPQDVPYGYKFYQLLSVFADFKATGKVSTDKCTRLYATIQESDCDHPKNLRVSEFFCANHLDEIKVMKSRYEKTSFY